MRAALSEFGRGLLDNFTLVSSFSSSRTLRLFALKSLPLYLTSIAIGLYFFGLGFVVNSDDIRIYWLLLWGVPAYIVGSFLQIRFAWLVTQIAKSKSSNNSVQSSAAIKIAEVVYGIVLNVTYLAQTTIYCWLASALIPRVLSGFVSNCVGIAMISWATSFAAFESRSIVKGLDLHQRLQYFEERWLYFLGYGLPASLCYNFLPSVFATGVWQFMQLLLTLRSLNLTSVPVSSLHRLRIFRVAQDLASVVINFIPF